MKKTKILAILTSMVLLAGIFAVMPLSVSAAEKYKAVTGGTTSFDKYLVMDEGANVPNVSFEYTITAGEEQSFSAENKTIAVYAGPTPEKISFTGDSISDTITTDQKFEITFHQGNSTTLYADKAVSDYVKNLDTGEKYAKKTASLDFSSVEFDEPGIYRYIITETNGIAQGIIYDADKTRVLDVYVENDTEKDHALVVSKYILHANAETVSINNLTYGSDGNIISTGTSNQLGDEASDYKSQGFTNEYISHDLTFSKKVAGNQASQDKYFAFTVTIENAAAGTQYDISYIGDDNEYTTDGNADTFISANPNSATTVIPADVTQPAFITVPEGETKVTQTFYLQHGQKISIRGLADGTKYTVWENPEDYIAAAVATNGEDQNTEDETEEGTAIILNNNKMTDSFIKGNAIVDFTNTRDGIIPTGVILAVGTPAILGFVVLGAMILLIVKNKRRETEEE